MNKRKTSPHPAALAGKKLDGMLNDFLRELKPSTLSMQETIFTLWDSIVGPKIAPLARPLCFEEGVLKVVVSSSTLLHLLSMHEKAKILRQLRMQIPSCGIQNILFRLG